MRDPDVAYGLINIGDQQVSLYDKDDIFLGCNTLQYCVMWNIPVRRDERESNPQRGGDVKHGHKEEGW